jgi:hypothetical protein
MRKCHGIEKFQEVSALDKTTTAHLSSTILAFTCRGAFVAPLHDHRSPRACDCCASDSQVQYQCYARMCPLSDLPCSISDPGMSRFSKHLYHSAACRLSSNLTRSEPGSEHFLDPDRKVDSARVWYPRCSSRPPAAKKDERGVVALMPIRVEESCHVKGLPLL